MRSSVFSGFKINIIQPPVLHLPNLIEYNNYVSNLKKKIKALLNQSSTRTHYPWPSSSVLRFCLFSCLPHKGNCRDFSEKCPPQAPVFESVLSSRWHCLERWCILAGGRMSLGVSWDSSSPLPLLHFPGPSLSFLLLPSCVLPAVTLPCHDTHLSLWNCKPKQALSSICCFWSQFFIRATGKWMISDM